jgi:hypothetical protein
MYEPERLDSAACAGFRLEDELREHNPNAYLNVHFYGVLGLLQPRIDEILRLPRIAARSAMVVPLLSPGPKDVSLVLAEQSAPLRNVLERLGHWDQPSVIFVVKGELSCSAIYHREGYRFLHKTILDANVLAVIPAEDRRELIMERGSIVLVASAGTSTETDPSVELFLGNLLGHFQISDVRPSKSVWRRLRSRDVQGNSVALRRHRRVEDLTAPGGVISFGVHGGEEEDERPTADICVVAPQCHHDSLSSAFSVDVMLY